MTRFTFSILLAFNLLYSGLTAQTCEITAVTPVALPCQGNSFLVTVDLDVVNPASPGFTLAGNGVIYGTFLYDDLPVTVGPLLGDDESVYEFIAWDVENADCQSYATLPAANCGPICSISNFELEFVDCISNQSAIVVFDFDYENPEGLTFDLFDDEGEEIGTFLYESLPVTLSFFEVNGAAPIVVTVCDHDNADCCETFTLDAIDCNTNNCEIFSVELDPQCTGNNFLVHMDFGYDNPQSDSFTITGNNLNYGTFAYTELPVTLGPLNGNTGINWTFNIEDTGSGNCGTTAVLGTYNCPPPCDVQALEALALECNGNEAFALEIGLEIEGEGDNGFAVFSETAYYGSYLYDELPLLLPEFVGSGEFIDIVSVCDNDNLGCCATTPFEALLCSGCLIYNLTATPLPCNSEDEIFVQINFDYQNQSMEGFEVSGNGNNYGQFAYEDLPIQIGPFVGDGSQYFEFVVTDLVNSLCFEAVEMGFIDCDTICELTNLVVETGDCTGNNTYVLSFDFDYQGVGGVGFDLFVNGQYFDSYNYQDLPVTIEDFPSNGAGTDTITVFEDGNELCFATLSFDAPDCQCGIFDMTAETLGCINDSTFTVSVDFMYENLNGDLVDVFLDGVIMGTFNVNDIPLVVFLPEGDGTGLLSVCANDISGCCDEQVIELIICETPQCGITDLVAETGDCNSDSTFLLDFVFEYANLPTDSITVTANGNYIGQYKIQPNFNRIEHFPILDSDTTTITVCAVGAPDCCDTYSFVTPDCSFFGQCHIWDLIADTGDCNSDSTYVLHIDFNSQNLSVDSVIVSGNGNFIGQYAVTADPIVIEHFPAFEDSLTTLIVCAVGESNCCDTLEFASPDCSQFGQCQIGEIEVLAGDCQSDTTYVLFVEFSGQNLPSDSVNVTANGNPLGQFAAGGGSFVIENFPVFETGVTELTICVVGAPDCCATLEFETPNCEGGGTCFITDLVADPGDCTSDSTYNLFIDYFNANLPLDSVTVTANEQFIGVYPHQSEGFIIENFPVFDANHTVLTVCAVGAPDCCDVFEFETPNCEGALDCHVFDLVADPGDCNGDSTYSLFIHYEVNNFPSDSVVVSTSEGYSGTFVHNPDGFTIEGFPAYNTSHTTITVCAQGAPDCCDAVEYLTPDCGQGFICEIYGLFAETGDCTSDSTYIVDIVFTGYNLGTDSVDIYANDVYLGAYYDDPEFIHIENFPHIQGEFTVITVCAQGSGECCASYTIETPACSGECAIFEIMVDPNVCNSDSTFALLVGYQYQNLPGAGIDAYSGDQYLGFYPFTQIPFEIPNFPSNETGNYVLTLCESDGELCCSTIEFNGPVCGSGNCSIFNLEYALTECDSAGQFYFILDFDYANTGSEGFNVIGNGNEYGNFSYENVPVQIGPFPTDETVYEFLVFDAQHPDCFDVIEPGDVECFVSTSPVDFDAFFTLLNNGSIPAVFAKQDITLSLYNANGKNVLLPYPMTTDDIYTLQHQPPGIYIANIVSGPNTWSVKLIKSGF
jgi:hypothetical protein